MKLLATMVFAAILCGYVYVGVLIWIQEAAWGR